MMKELMRMDQKKAASDEVAMQSSRWRPWENAAVLLMKSITPGGDREKAGWMKELLGMEDLARARTSRNCRTR